MAAVRAGRSDLLGSVRGVAMAGDPAHRTVKVGERRLRVLEDRDLPAELAASSALQSGSQPCTAWPTTNEPGSRDLPTRASRAVPGSPRKEGRGHRADSLPDRVARPRRPAGPVDPVRRKVRTPLRGHDASPLARVLCGRQGGMASGRSRTALSLVRSYSIRSPVRAPLSRSRSGPPVRARVLSSTRPTWRSPCDVGSGSVVCVDERGNG